MYTNNTLCNDSYSNQVNTLGTVQNNSNTNLNQVKLNPNSNNNSKLLNNNALTENNSYFYQSPTGKNNQSILNNMNNQSIQYSHYPESSYDNSAYVNLNMNMNSPPYGNNNLSSMNTPIYSNRGNINVNEFDDGGYYPENYIQSDYSAHPSLPNNYKYNSNHPNLIPTHKHMSSHSYNSMQNQVNPVNHVNIGLNSNKRNPNQHSSNPLSINTSNYTTSRDKVKSKSPGIIKGVKLGNPTLNSNSNKKYIEKKLEYNSNLNPTNSTSNNYSNNNQHNQYSVMFTSGVKPYKAVSGIPNHQNQTKVNSYVNLNEQGQGLGQINSNSGNKLSNREIINNFITENSRKSPLKPPLNSGSNSMNPGLSTNSNSLITNTTKENNSINNNIKRGETGKGGIIQGVKSLKYSAYK